MTGGGACPRSMPSVQPPLNRPADLVEDPAAAGVAAGEINAVPVAPEPSTVPKLETVQYRPRPCQPGRAEEVDIVAPLATVAGFCVAALLSVTEAGERRFIVVPVVVILRRTLRCRVGDSARGGCLPARGRERANLDGPSLFGYRFLRCQAVVFTGSFAAVCAPAKHVHGLNAPEVTHRNDSIVSRPPCGDGRGARKMPTRPPARAPIGGPSAAVDPWRRRAGDR